MTEINELKARIAELEEQIAEFQDYYERVVNEQCATDELHCTCVPALRKRIAEHDEEIRQFNDGFKAGERGDPEEQPHYDTDYDTWMCGYAWGAFDGLKARIAELEPLAVLGAVHTAPPGTTTPDYTITYSILKDDDPFVDLTGDKQ